MFLKLILTISIILQSFFRTIYYIAKNIRPFDDHTELIELQQYNGINLGTTLYSRYSSTSIIAHIAKEKWEKKSSNHYRDIIFIKFPLL